MLDLASRRKVVEDVIAQSPTIASSTPGGSLDSEFISLSDLPPLSSSLPHFPNVQRQSPIAILNSDTLSAARSLLTSSPRLHGKVAVLNLANDQEPGGGWRYTLSTTQEEALCYSSTLYATLKPEFYPWPNLGPGSAAGIYSPGIVVFRDTLDNDLAVLPSRERFVVAVLTAAAPCRPKLTEDRLGFARQSDLDDLTDKIRWVLRCAAQHGKTCLVLGAFGCGAFGCPPRLVAREMRKVLEDEEFEGWFEVVVFAIYAAGPTGQENLQAFREVFGA